MDGGVRAWQARPDDLDAAGRLLHDFNVEFGEPTPLPPALASRLRALTAGGDTVVLLADHARRVRSGASVSAPLGAPAGAVMGAPVGAPVGAPAGASVGGDPLGLAVLRLREAIWSESRECYLAELYVVPSHRRQGIGRALVLAAMDLARTRGATTMDIGVDEPDLAARALYESLGFSNRTGTGAHVMYVYERGL